MTTYEISMLLVKPDGVVKGLVDEIKKIIISKGLTIVEEFEKTLKPETVKQLYWEISDVRNRDYFPQLIKFMSSSPVHIFVVQGKDAVKAVRAIIGKREPPSGIRQKWATSIICNVAHGPHTLERARQEIKLLLDKEA